MNNVLVSDALKKVWCNPFQDTQFIVEPARITTATGAVGTFPLAFDTVALPTPSDIYHVFQIGALDPSYLNLPQGEMVWKTVTEIMRSQRVLANVYTEDGFMVPRFECWVLSYYDGNLLIAVKDQGAFKDLTTQDVFLRLYSNAWFHTADGAASAGIYSAGFRIVNLGDGVPLQNLATFYQAKPGAVQYFHNGFYVDNIQPNRLQFGDSVELVYDASVRQVVDFPVASLPSFLSTLDSKEKYLLHNPVKQGAIDYQDDIDLYLVQPGAGSVFQSVYYHKNNADAMRQVTHQDYAIPGAYVSAYQEDYAQIWGPVTGLTVRMFIRQAATNRPLIYENARLFELYKLPDADIVPAMVGTASNVTVWKAASLEANAYVGIMGSKSADVTQSMVQSAYGYNAISKLTGNCLLPIVNVLRGKGADLPYNLQTNSTIYEYDVNRKLIGIYNHTSGTTYYPVNLTCTLIEAFTGTGSLETGIVFNPSSITLNPSIGQRIYMCSNFNGDFLNDWVDITGNTTWYTVSNTNHVVWVRDITDKFIAVKDDATFLTYTTQTQSVDGLQLLTVQGNMTYPDGEDALGTVMIPTATVDVWMNGYSLVKDVDFIVQWPQISINNLKYQDPSGIQQFTIRAYGFCNPDMTMLALSDTGFVKYNVLSRNGRYDIRDDRVMRMVINGGVYMQSELAFSEENSSLSMPGIANGLPYSLEEILVPLRDVVTTDTYTMRNASRVIDAQVGAYMTPFEPDPVETLPDGILELYPLYSPFMTKVISDVVSGAISMANFKVLYSDDAIKPALVNYVNLLPFDPLVVGFDPNHVGIKPHPFATNPVLSLYQYKFLQVVNRVYLGDQLNLSPYLGITTTGL